MEQLKGLDLLSLREKKEYSGIPAGLGFKPLCCLSDASEKEIYYVVSEGGAVPEWSLFKKSHAFTLCLLNGKGERILRFKKHSGLFANKVEVFDANEDLLGSVYQPGGSKPRFRTLDVGESVSYDIEDFPDDPEAFHIRKGDTMLGKISKRPTRTAEEGIARKDPFGIVFPFAADTSERAVLLGALFLIDLTF